MAKKYSNRNKNRSKGRTSSMFRMRKDDERWGTNQVNKEKKSREYRRLKDLAWSDKQIKKLTKKQGRLIISRKFEPRGWGSYQERARRASEIDKEKVKESARKTKEAIGRGARAVAAAPGKAGRVALETAKKPFKWKVGYSPEVDTYDARLRRERQIKVGIKNFSKLNVQQKDALLKRLDRQEEAIRLSSDPAEARTRLYGDNQNNARKLRALLIDWNKNQRAQDIKGKPGFFSRKASEVRAYGSKVQKRQELSAAQKAKEAQRVSERKSEKKEGFGPRFMRRLEGKRDEDRARRAERAKKVSFKDKRPKKEEKEEIPTVQAEPVGRYVY